ncbi:MAG: hypothetical protein L6Q92_15220 [Phycisphaerae bacterium]|nr:hypothetical protein [Phycisphaerae bacterium]
MVALAPRSAFAFSMTAAVWLAGLAAAQPASAQDVLLHRQAPNRLGGSTSDTLYLRDSGAISSVLSADRFRLTQANVVYKLTAWGYFGRQIEDLDPLPPVTETMRVRFYADAGGVPGELRYEEEFLNPSRVFTGFFVSGGPVRKEYRYDVTLSAGFPVAANTDFWLEVAQIGDLSSRFQWESSTSTTDGFAQQFPIGNPWQYISGIGQLAYELRTPEPGSGALVLSVGMLMARRTRRRWRGR